MTTRGDVDVLIVGGGPVGLASSLALSRRGLRSLLVERHPGTALLPKALHLSTRTMEVLRQWGVAEAARALALPATAHGLFLGASLADPDFVRHAIWPDDPTVSAERSTLVSQEVLEPALRAAAQAAALPGDLRFATTVIDLDIQDDGVLVQLDGGAGRTSVRARWVLGADGANSAVRRAAGIEFPGADVHRSVNILFNADLTRLVADRSSSFYYVHNDEVRGLLPVVDNSHHWRLHLVIAEGETAEDYQDPSRRLALIRAAVGVPELQVELGPVYGWTGGARVAQRFRAGRLLLAGDAAHINPPAGGLGMNCGLQDAHNLAWKLAEVVNGHAHPDLLDTYEAERRPVAQRTVTDAVRNHEFESAPVRSDADRRRKHDRRRQAGIVLGQHYEEGAFVPDGTPLPPVGDPYSDFIPVARPGHRAPHLWVEVEGRRTTILDVLTYTHFTLLVAGPDDEAWAAAAQGADVTVHTVGAPPCSVLAPTEAFCSLYGLHPGGGVLIRPDGIVALRVARAPSLAAARTALASARAALHACTTIDA